MPKLIQLPSYETPDQGHLTVIEGLLPFTIRRVYYIYKAQGQRGGHRHKKTIQALVCVAGSCKIHCHDGQKTEEFWLNSPDRLLLLESKDWHTMSEFSPDAVLLVLASELYDREDYIDEAYP
jgi:dTDP-4-dehydrorhamnose 3,5-epimerase-like enzyme